METLEVSVTVEQSLHRALLDLAQKTWDLHGIVIRSIEFGWTDVSKVDQPQFIVFEVETEMTSKPGKRQ